MQSISFYESAQSAALQPALRGLCDPHRGLEARYLLTTTGWFARFVWPDWPAELANLLRAEVECFLQKHRHLQTVRAGSPEWDAVSRGWRTDADSAQIVGESFDRHLPGRARWARAEKDRRGRVEARCMIEGLGVASLSLAWRNSAAYPPGPIAECDRAVYEAAAKEIFEWARQRIQSVLDSLSQRLRALYGGRFRGLYVFGSYARPDAGIELPEDSDLDVALVLSETGGVAEEIDRYGQVIADLSLEHGLTISLVPVREVDFREGRTNFTRVISEYAIPVK